jgi:hypothetical protein
MKTINLIYYNNGVGLSKDSQILELILKNNFLINRVEYNGCSSNCPVSDINIFLQNIDPYTIQFISKAKTNILIPNLEWMFQYSLDNINKFDMVFSKSKECKQILNSYHKNVIYTGFTSVDRFNPNIPKTKQFLHFGGKSIQKYTEMVVDVFSELNLPITIVDATERFKGKTTSNIDYIPYFLSDKEVDDLFNSHSIHICCSLSEGWGHYIYEALSCKSAVIINDCPPENELLTNDIVFKVKTNKSETIKSLHFKETDEFPLRKLNFTDRSSLLQTIQNMVWLCDKDFQRIRDVSRKTFLKIDKDFKTNFIKRFKTLL